MKYKMIAFDLDGTLVDDQKRLLPGTVGAIMAIQQMGVKVVLASGRPTYGCRQVAKDLRLDEFGGYIVSYNGGKITSCEDGKILARRALPREQLDFLYKAVKEEPELELFTYHQQAIITENPENEYVKQEQWVNGGMPIRKVDHLLKALVQDPLKVAVVGEFAPLHRLKERMEAHYGEELNFFLTNEHFLDAVPSGVDKGTSLDFLLQDQGIERKDLIAVGDSYNDLSMIQLAGLGVAMANATEAVKRSADYVTTSNNEGGILHLLNKFILSPEETNVEGINVEDLNRMMAGNTLMSSLGIECIKLEPGYVECTMPVDKRTQQPMGILHGGASLALAETVAGYGSVLLLKENEIQVGMQVSGNHISSAHSGDTVRAIGRVIHQGRSSHVWDIEVRTEMGKLVHTSRVVNSILKKR